MNVLKEDRQAFGLLVGKLEPFGLSNTVRPNKTAMSVSDQFGLGFPVCFKIHVMTT